MSSPSASAVWPVVQEERRALIQDLATLQPQDWLTPSLCPGWDVHDVLAHLVDTAKTTRLGFVRRMITARFNFDQDNDAGVQRERAADPRATLAEFRAVQARRTGPPVPIATRLVEAFVHGEDIRRPLGMNRTYPSAHVAAALRYQLRTSVKIGGGKELANGWRLTATDDSFAQGSGPVVYAPLVVLLLAVSGRAVAADALGGPGAAEFFRFTAPAQRTGED